MNKLTAPEVFLRGGSLNLSKLIKKLSHALIFLTTNCNLAVRCIAVANN